MVHQSTEAKRGWCVTGVGAQMEEMKEAEEREGARHAREEDYLRQQVPDALPRADAP